MASLRVLGNEGAGQRRVMGSVIWLQSECWVACGQWLVSRPSCPVSVWHSQCPAPQGSACLSPQHTCPLGMSSQWPRFHGDTEPFPISGMLSTALGWALPPLPFARGEQTEMCPTARGLCSSFSALGAGHRAPRPLHVLGLPWLQYLTLSSRWGDVGCLGHAEVPVTAGLDLGGDSGSAAE